MSNYLSGDRLIFVAQDGKTIENVTVQTDLGQRIGVVVQPDQGHVYTASYMDLFKTERAANFAVQARYPEA